jgi:hypothetical protein
MKFDIDDKVIVRFSEERKDSDPMFRMADGEFATVVERYTQAHLLDVFFYEVELETPIKVGGQSTVLLSGLLEKELELVNPISEKKKINPKYLTKDARAMKDEIKKHAHKDDDDSSAYNSHPKGGWKADYDKSSKPYKTKVSQHTKKFKEMFGESAINEGQVDAALKTKAEKTGISKTILKKVYNRGLAAWKTGHRPGVSQHQWAMARVNSFATKGKGTWGKADKDLAQKVRATNESIRMGSDGRFTWEENDRVFVKKLEYINIDTYDEPKTFPPEVLAYIKDKYPDQDRLTELGLSGGIKLEGFRPEQCIVSYLIEPVFGRYGLEELDVVVLKVVMKFSIDLWNEDTEDNEYWDELIELVDDQNLNVVNKIKYRVEANFPIELENIEIRMNHSWDPKEFKYEVRFGE